MLVGWLAGLLIDLIKATPSAADPFNFDTTVCKNGNKKTDCSILAGWLAGWVVGWMAGWLAGLAFHGLSEILKVFVDLVS